MSKINELKQQRARLVAEARAILERAENERRARNADEDAQWSRINTDIDALGKRIADEERVAELEADLRTAPAPAIAGGEQRGGKVVNEEQRAAFWRVMKGERIADSELRALNITTDAQGGYTVPDEFERALVVALQNANVMRQISRVLPSVSGDKLVTVEADAGTAAWLDEAAGYTESNPAFGRVTFGACKLGRIAKASEEFLQDSFLATEAYLADVFARSFGTAEEAAMVAGNGTGKPTGVISGASNTQAAAAAAITADNMIDLAYKVKQGYRANGSYLMHDSTAAALRKLKGSDDQYLWQPSVQQGQPDVFNGRPVFTSDAMPTIGTGKTSVVFGDFSYYWIVDRLGRSMQRLNELYAANGQIGFKMHQRLDGKVVLGEAFAKLVHA